MDKPIKSSGAVLILKDGRIALQRRDGGAPTDANLLCTFGGHFKENESSESAFERELHEETSLPALPHTYLGRYSLAKSGRRSRHDIYVYKVHLDSESPDFKVFEGAGAEAYRLDELLQRSDLEPDTQHVLKRIKEENRWL